MFQYFLSMLWSLKKLLRTCLLTFFCKIKLVNQRIPHQKKEKALRAQATQIIVRKVKYPLCFIVSYCMFNPLHSIINQELFEKHLCNQSSHYEKHRQYPLQREAIMCNHQIDTFTSKQG